MVENLISFGGFLSFVFIAWLLSTDRRRIQWRPVLLGMLFQLIFAGAIFLLPQARVFFLFLSDIFTRLLEYSRGGLTFVFGDLAAVDSKAGFILAFQALPFIIVFSSLMSLLYYLKVIPFVIKYFARFLAKSLKTSGAESLCAASNLFVGVESAVSIKPYIIGMTKSELFTVLVAGMSTVASSVLAIYVSFLSPVFPAIAGHLISASVISIPAVFVVSKLMIPETGKPETADFSTCELHVDRESSGMVESLITGAMNGWRLTVGVGVTLIAFIGIVSILSGFLDYIFGTHNILVRTFGYIFQPFVYLMGIQPSEVSSVSEMLGERIILTEIPAYRHLSTFAENGGSMRSVLITSYALCGFAHIASVAIFVGGIGALAPKRISELSKLGLRALLAATIVTMMTGAVAGIFYMGQQGLIE